jgi:hypothetical protein
MKKFLLLVLVVGSGWWHFHGWRILSEQSVNDFYHQQAIATLSRNPELLCNQLATDYKSSVVFISAEGRAVQEANKTQSCDALIEMYANFEKIGAQMGGMLQLDYNYQIQKITISSDKKSAVVETSFTLNIAGSLMNFNASSVDTLIRRNGKVMLLRSEGKTRLSSG